MQGAEVGVAAWATIEARDGGDGRKVDACEWMDRNSLCGTKRGRDFFNPNLFEADLEGAVVTDEQLAQIVSLQGATMPDGTKHE